MKKILSIFLMIFLCSAAVFADDEGDEYDDGYVYQMNGVGDQVIKLEFNGFFPLNFKDQLNNGGGATISFLTFVSDKVALGGSFSLLTSLTIGEKSYIFLPFTFSALFQPTIGKFEFPLEANIGVAVHTMASQTYFPALTLKGSAGVFYRFSESWSAGISGSYIYSPEWFKNTAKNFDGMYVLGSASVRFHF